MEKKGIPGIISCQNVALTTPLTFDPGQLFLNDGRAYGRQVLKH